MGCEFQWRQSRFPAQTPMRVSEHYIDRDVETFAAGGFGEDMPEINESMVKNVIGNDALVVEKSRRSVRGKGQVNGHPHEVCEHPVKVRGAEFAANDVDGA